MADTVTATGQSGTKYELEIYPVGTAFNPVGGVYVFLAKTAQGSWNPIYIGETSDFNERLNTGLHNHQAWTCGHANGTTHFGVKVIAGSGQVRIDVETDLRHNHNTPCNKQ